MRYGQRSQDAGWQGTGVAARVEAWSVMPGDGPASVIEELGGAPVASVRRPVDRRLGLVVGLIAALVGFGFMTRDTDGPPSRAGDAGTSSAVAVRSAEPTTLDGTVAPLLSAAGTGATGAGMSVAIGVSEDAEGAKWLTVDASGVSSDQILDIAARTASGDLVGQCSVAAASDDERPASDGGARVGAGTLRARILVAGNAPPGTLGVTIAWRDGRGGPTWSISGPPGCRSAPR